MRLMRTSEVIKRPVVTMAGDAVAQVKDVVYTADGGSVAGFTLAGRGLLAGPLKKGLTWESVAALGSDALMIRDESVMEPTAAVVDKSRGSSESAGDVLGSRVLTDSGVDLGAVHDVVVSVEAGATCDVVGYEVKASEALSTQGELVLVPLPDTIAASGEHLMVPASAKDFVGQDLAGFGAAVEAFRSQLKGPSA